MNKLKLDKSNIIKNRSEFSHAIRDGLIYKGKFFLIAVVANTQLRYGFTTKSGLSKPDRNRLKRLARELWRIWQSGYDLHGDCIVITREQALKASFKMLESDFRALLGLLEKSRQAGQL